MEQKRAEHSKKWSKLEQKSREMEGKWMGNRSPKRSIVALMRFAQSSQFETLHDNAALAVSKAPRGNSHVVELGKGWGLTQRSLTSLRRPWPRSRSRRRRPGPWSCQSRRRCRPCRSRRPWRPAARTRLRQGRGGGTQAPSHHAGQRDAFGSSARCPLTAVLAPNAAASAGDDDNAPSKFVVGHYA